MDQVPDNQHSVSGVNLSNANKELWVEGACFEKTDGEKPFPICLCLAVCNSYLATRLIFFESPNFND
jgi:hypothetical protein